MHKRHHHHLRGFTLIEMMVVMLIIGILVSSIVLSVNTDDLSEHMEIEIKRLHALVNLARDEAIMQGHKMALGVTENSYKFQWYDLKDEKWKPVDDSKVFRERELLPGTEMVLVIEEREYEIKKSKPGTRLKVGDDETDQENEEDENITRLEIYPSGEIFPFELILRKLDYSTEFKLLVDENGELALEIPDSVS